MKKSLCSLILLIALCTIALAPTSYMYAANVSTITPIVYVNKQKVDSDAYIANGYAMISFRDIFSQFDMNVDWNQATKTVTATSKDGSQKIVLSNASPVIHVNGKSIKVAQAPALEGNILYVNLRVISEGLGANVQFIKSTPNHGQYHTSSSSIYITKKK